MLKAIGLTVLACVAILAGMLAYAALYPDPFRGHILRVVEPWAWRLENAFDMETAAEAGLTNGCQTAGLYSHHGFDYSDHLRIRFLNRPEWPEKRLIWTEVDGAGRAYVARLDTDERTILCQEVRDRATYAGY